ncbi:MAG: DinB family protein [Segetibacter sp.]
MQVFLKSHLWDRPAGVASVGFHLQHLTGVLDRLFTYAQNKPLSKYQLEYLSKEGNADQCNLNTQQLVQLFNEQVDKSLEELSNTNEQTMQDYRSVGRSQLPSTVLGLLFHSADHTMRHVGQLLVTVKVIK